MFTKAASKDTSLKVLAGCPQLKMSRHRVNKGLMERFKDEDPQKCTAGGCDTTQYESSLCWSATRRSPEASR